MPLYLMIFSLIYMTYIKKLEAKTAAQAADAPSIGTT